MDGLVLLTKRSARNCPHSNLRGIYGDEVNHTGGFYRLQCMDCWRFLDGPVVLAEMRKNELQEMRSSQGGRNG
jgi:hypothetical protein